MKWNKNFKKKKSDSKILRNHKQIKNYTSTYTPHKSHTNYPTCRQSETLNELNATEEQQTVLWLVDFFFQI